ncbi:MAG: hypothetical protein CME70_12965 [Halobacteriovorax sp.]|nr:hypothetical protein [Halobacteriovorax sp.]
MINQLQILHTKPEQTIQLEPGYIEWKTCLRSIFFGKNLSSPTHSGVHAYRFLLEIVCGLHSPLIGETEILCQFKNFIKENPKTITPKISQKIIKDAKYLRTKYLKNYGSQSYGSYALKKSAPHDRIIIFGAGSLAQEILPIIKSSCGEIIIKVRNVAKAIDKFSNYRNIQIESLEKRNQKENALIIIAAPISSEVLESIIHSNYSSSSILDLRSVRDGRALQIEESYQYKTLKEIFSEIEETQKVLHLTSIKMKEEIKELSNKWNKQAIARPFGWEDLCL